MTKRPLTHEEVLIYTENMNNAKTKLSKIKSFYLPKAKLEVEHGLDISYQKTKDDYLQIIKSYENEIIDLETSITICEDALKGGVEIKEVNPIKE